MELEAHRWAMVGLILATTLVMLVLLVYVQPYLSVVSNCFRAGLMGAVFAASAAAVVVVIQNDASSNEGDFAVACALPVCIVLAVLASGMPCLGLHM